MLRRRPSVYQKPLKPAPGTYTEPGSMGCGWVLVLVVAEYTQARRPDHTNAIKTVTERGLLLLLFGLLRGVPTFMVSFGFNANGSLKSCVSDRSAGEQLRLLLDEPSSFESSDDKVTVLKCEEIIRVGQGLGSSKTSSEAFFFLMLEITTILSSRFALSLSCCGCCSTIATALTVRGN